MLPCPGLVTPGQGAVARPASLGILLRREEYLVVNDLRSGSTSTGEFGDERLDSHVEARRLQRALEHRIDGPFEPVASLILEQLNSMTLSTSTGEAR